MTHSARTALSLIAVSTALAGCSSDAPPEGADTPDGPAMTATSSAAGLAGMLANGQAVFGIFSGDHDRAGGMAMAANRETDFVFYSLENGPFDIPAMQEYMAGMAEATGAQGAHPMVLRVPPPHEDAATRDHVRQGLAAGIDGIVYPHVQNAEQAALAVDAMGDGVWPDDPDGSLINVLIIEDQEGIGNARAIMETGGISVAIPGPGDLRRAYDGDMVAVEDAIQQVLALCLEMNVACGITAGVDDIAGRLDQGFKMIIVTAPEALAVGKRAAGR